MSHFLLELDQLERRATALRAQIAATLLLRNSRSSVYRLPTEILGQIFLLCRDVAVNVEWIKVSHVSHAWRAAALHYPALWTSPDLLHTPLAAEMLYRSQRTPVAIRLTLPRTSGLLLPASSFRAVLDRCTEVPDIRSLECATTDNTLGRLEPLIVLLAHGLRSITIHHDTPDQSLPHDILTATFPQLHTLDTVNTVPRWGLPLFRTVSLSVLRIQYQPADAEGVLPYTFSYLINALQALPALEELALQYCIPWDERPVLGERVHLPSLHSLRLSGDSEPCLSLCKHLIHPPLTRTNLCFEGVDDADLPDAMAMTVPPDLPLCVVCLQNTESRIFSTQDGVPGQLPPSHQLHLPMGGASTAYYTSVVEKTGDVLAASRARTVVLSLEIGMDVQWFKLLMGRSNAVIVQLELSCYHSTLSELLYSIVLALQGGALPNMETLDLHGLMYVDTREKSALETLVVVLQSRSQNGIFRRLGLMDVSEIDTLVAHWKTMLPEVEWTASSILRLWIDEINALGVQ